MSCAEIVIPPVKNAVTCGTKRKFVEVKKRNLPP